ncbi:MAG: PP2C family protein-serine/threonine phosphatase [Thermoanaerobaculia bacterium]
MISLLGREIRLGGGLMLTRTPEQSAEYYRLNPPRSDQGASFLERPLILWMESTGELPRLADGKPEVEDLTASMAASPSTLFRALLSTSAEVDSAAWIALAGFSVLFAEIYLVAAAIAIFMIFGLSRAVNRLSRATEAIGQGDFSTRIPVRRTDQLGDLQRSFNSMSEHLEELVQTAAQKEVLDKELALARQVQQDLLPAEIADFPGVEFATHFEPSAAIGGDYYDILEDGRGRLAVVIADVAGHGLAAGLRMALVKAGVALQIEDEVAASEIFERLHRLLRKRSGERSFVTASLTNFDPATGALTLTNAGHPPSYVVRAAGEVDELLAPGVPLGVMSGTPGVLTAQLGAGDSVVWLSDGLIEGTDRLNRQFGFDGVRKALAGPAASASEVRDRLLAGLRAHTGGRPADDDRTLVVMRYVASNGRAEASAAPASSPR